MRPRRLALLTRGDPDQRTGGYLYNARILDALRACGVPGVVAVDQIVLPEESGPGETRRALGDSLPALLIVDSIAFEQVLPLLGWLRREGVPVVALMHMLPSAQAEDAERVRLAERAFLRDIDGAIAVSDALAEQLVEAGAPTERVRVVVPGRDGVPVRRRRAGPPEVTRFLTVANWTPNKGIHHAVAAFLGLRASGRRARLDLVGAPGEGAYADAVRELLAASPYAGDVRAWGTLSPNELAGRYADADVFLLPSRSEGFGIVFAEALSHGLPVLACRVGPIPALVPGTCGILVPPGDPVALEAAMARLADDPRLRRQMALQARRRARQLPTWEESGREFCRIVENMGRRYCGNLSLSQGHASHVRNFGAPRDV